MRARVLIAAAVTAATLAACGTEVDVAPRAERQLQARFDEVVAAVTAADRLDARSALRELERTVGELTSAGLVSEERAAQILSAAEGVAAQLSLLPAPEPSPSPIPSPTLSPTPEPTEDPTEEPEEKPEKPEKPPKGEAHGHDEDHGEG